MTQRDLQQIEKNVGFTLPAYYRATLLSYPFTRYSFADEFMLPNWAEEVIDLNDMGFSFGDIDQPFFVGSDGGEERYFVDASVPDSGVFAYELESGKYRPLSPSWTAYLDHIRDTEAEIAVDEAAERERRRTRKWWQFWS